AEQKHETRSADLQSREANERHDFPGKSSTPRRGDSPMSAGRACVVRCGTMTAKSSLSDAPTMPAVAPRDREPKPPFPPQHQEQPGREARLNVRPRFQAEEYHAAGKLKGRAALITGGDSGIGRAVAVLFAREGADIAINYLAEEQEDAEETRRVVEKAGRKCVLIPGDLRERDFCDQLIQQTVEKLGHLEILVS